MLCGEVGGQVSEFGFHLKTEDYFGISMAACALGSHLIWSLLLLFQFWREGREEKRNITQEHEKQIWVHAKNRRVLPLILMEREGASIHGGETKITVPVSWVLMFSPSAFRKWPQWNVLAIPCSEGVQKSASVFLSVILIINLWPPGLFCEITISRFWLAV